MEQHALLSKNDLDIDYEHELIPKKSIKDL
jgi:hypothetical protein